MADTLLAILGADYSPAVVGVTFAYFFHRIPHKELVKELATPDDPKRGKRIYEIVKDNGYILKNCKLYAYAYHYYRKCKEKGKSAIKPSARAFGVSTEDARILRRLNLNHIKPLRKPWSLRQMDQLVGEFISSKETQAYIGRFISKKLLFLIKSYGEKRDDLEAGMIQSAVREAYKNYPRFESHLYFVNRLKSAIKSYGHTKILYHTRECRQALSHDGHQHQAVHVTDELYLKNLEAPPSYLEHIRDSLHSLSSLKLGETAQQFLKLATGQFDEQFSLFLKADNSAVVEKMDYSKYLEKIQRYMNISDERVHAFFSRLRMHL